MGTVQNTLIPSLASPKVPGDKLSPGTPPPHLFFFVVFVVVFVVVFLGRKTVVPIMKDTPAPERNTKISQNTL